MKIWRSRELWAVMSLVLSSAFVILSGRPKLQDFREAFLVLALIGVLVGLAIGTLAFLRGGDEPFSGASDDPEP